MRTPANKIYFISCIFLFMSACDQGGLPDGMLECANQDTEWCYREFTNRSGCYVLVKKYSSKNAFTWSGSCKNGLAQGRGKGTWKRYTGFSFSKDKSGLKVFKEKFEEAVYEGSYTDGKRVGMWVLQQEGHVLEGPYVNGQENGKWVMQLKNGGVLEGPYVNGQEHGKWVLRRRNGSVQEILYKNGRKVRN